MRTDTKRSHPGFHAYELLDSLAWFFRLSRKHIRIERMTRIKVPPDESFTGLVAPGIAYPALP